MEVQSAKTELPLCGRALRTTYTPHEQFLEQVSKIDRSVPEMIYSVFKLRITRVGAHRGPKYDLQLYVEPLADDYDCILEFLDSL